MKENGPVPHPPGEPTLSTILCIGVFQACKHGLILPSNSQDQ